MANLVMLDNIEGAKLLDRFIRARLVYEAVPLDAEQRREYLLTPAAGASRGHAISDGNPPGNVARRGLH